MHTVRTMMSTIDHRGPEECGYAVDDRAAVGLTRLAIIDVPFGKQPMLIDDDRHWLVFNGTIVNYLELRVELEQVGIRFRTNCDTEVLAQALVRWGTGALPRLNGSFAFALYDRRERRLLLGRDPIGERPLFYTRVNDGLAFSSEIKGLLALPGVARSLSPLGLQQTYASWCPIDPTTCFEGIVSLPPGHFAVYEGGRLSTTRFWQLPYGEDQTDRSESAYEQAQEDVRDSLSASVDIRLRSDFGAGVLLSGGVDSAVIAALTAPKVSGRLKTYSFTLPGSALDESEAQLRVAQHLDTDHSSVAITPEQTRELFPQAVYHAETPLFRTSAVAVGLLAKLVHDSGQRVVLFGPGSDEIFGGYDTAGEASFLERYNRFGDDAARVSWLKLLFHDTGLTKKLDFDAIARYYASPSIRQQLLGPHARRFSSQPGLADIVRDELVAQGADDLLDMLGEAIANLDPNLSRRPPVERSRAIDMLNLCSGWGLNSFADRVAVPAGVEFRAPFLDVAVIAKFWRLPEEFTLGKAGVNKRVLRDAFRGMLPSDVLNRRKQGLRALDAEVLLPWAADDWVSDVVRRAERGESAIVDPRQASSIVAAMTDPARSSPGSFVKHAYCLMLSTMLLEDKLIRDYDVPARPGGVNLVKAIDLRGRDA